MKDHLLDLIEHTLTVGNMDVIKVTGTDKETKINAVTEGNTAIIEGIFKTPIADFIGVFGMPNLNKLKTILSFDDYDDKARIFMKRVERNGVQTPESIQFETSNSDFINVYRLMNETIVTDKVKTLSFKGATWNVEFNPSVASILRLKKQASANSEEQQFTTKVEGGNLKIYFGDAATHSGNFIFEAGITGSLSHAWQWPVQQVLNILSLSGDKTMKISDQGVAEITVDSGLTVYRYLIPAQSK